MLSTVLTGLNPGMLYQVEVAAVTVAGLGTRSQPVSILISESTGNETFSASLLSKNDVHSSSPEVDYVDLVIF